MDGEYPSQVLKLPCSPKLMCFIHMIEFKRVFFDMAYVLNLCELVNL